jgi:isoleucyl-tRNA synthetase
VNQVLEEKLFLEEIKKNYFIDVLLEELNIKNFGLFRDLENEIVELDTMITPELKLEGEMREIIRALQEGRKKAGFNVEDRIVLGYSVKEGVFEVHQDEIAHEVLATEVQNGELADAEYTNTVEIEGTSFTFWLKRS